VFILARVLLNRHWLTVWRPFDVFLSSGRADLLPLIALGLAVGLLMRMAQIRTHQRIYAAEQSQRQAEAMLSENAAVVRACRAVVREFAQPLTGALAYSEMLVADATYISEAQRHEVEGLREGVLRMERLLQCLRDAITDTAAIAEDRSIADEVEHAVALPRARQMFGQGARAQSSEGGGGYEAPCCSDAGLRSV
jgi:signal transduction histidine kinase